MDPLRATKGEEGWRVLAGASVYDRSILLYPSPAPVAAESTARLRRPNNAQTVANRVHAQDSAEEGGDNASSGTLMRGLREIDAKGRRLKNSRLAVTPSAVERSCWNNVSQVHYRVASSGGTHQSSEQRPSLLHYQGGGIGEVNGYEDAAGAETES